MTTTAARTTHVRIQRTITYAGARAAADAALERAAEIGVAVNVAVTDPIGCPHRLRPHGRSAALLVRDRAGQGLDRLRIQRHRDA